MKQQPQQEEVVSSDGKTMCSRNDNSRNVVSVVFACKSNSCRSQMAEGWAKEWIREEKEKAIKESDETKMIILDSLFIESVALDKSSVFTTTAAAATSMVNNNNTTIADDKVISSSGDACKTCDEYDADNIDSAGVSVGEREDSKSCTYIPKSKRKEVKSKAIKALAEDGVDIRNHEPSTSDEIVYRILNRKKLQASSNHDGGNNNAQDLQLYSQKQKKQQQQQQPVIDNLIIMCNCGYDVKKDLIDNSKVVVELNIDAPTAIAKKEGDDTAYRRISLQIKDHVDDIMHEIIATM